MQQMFCTSCGAKILSSETEICPECSKPLRPFFDEEKERYEQFVFEVDQKSIPEDSTSVALSFDGRTREYILWMILLVLGTVLSVGLLYPYVSIHFFRWKTLHTMIGGKRLHFLGDSKDYWFLFWKNFLLTVITLGIYSFQAYINLKKWRTENVVLGEKNL